MISLNSFDPPAKWWNWFSDAKKKVVRTNLADIREVLLDVGCCGVVGFERFQIAPEAAMFAIEVEHCLRITDRGANLALAMENAGVGHNTLDVRVAVTRYLARVETVKRLAQSVPLAVDDSPAQSGLENSTAQDGEVVSKRWRLDLFMRTTAQIRSSLANIAASSASIMSAKRPLATFS
jgi:hypothetical protein